MKITFEDTRGFGNPDPPETVEIHSLRLTSGNLYAKGIPEDEEYVLATYRSLSGLWITLNNTVFNNIKVVS